jgi:hypothetical protein
MVASRVFVLSCNRLQWHLYVRYRAFFRCICASLLFALQKVGAAPVFEEAAAFHYFCGMARYVGVCGAGEGRDYAVAMVIFLGNGVASDCH